MSEAAAPDPSRGRVTGLPLRGPARLLSDERLARRATSGDRRALEEIFRRYHQDLYRFCLATVSNPQDAQEALQNTMVKVMRALPGEEREIKLKPWLFRVARNEAVETLRKRRDTVELSADRLAAAWETAEAAGARDRLRELFTDLGELPERQRSALVMRELAGLEFTEIGEAFGTSAAVARQTLYEARQSLRQMDEGREMSCESVRRTISDADGRVTRRRDLRAHLRDCAGCRAFRDDIRLRREGFAAVAPLPAAVSVGLLQSVIGGQAAAGGVAAGAGATGGGIGSALGVGTGQAVATSAIVKSAATVAVVTAVGVGAADRGGLIDLPTPGGAQPAAQPEGTRGASPDAPEAAGDGDTTAERRLGGAGPGAGAGDAAGGPPGGPGVDVARKAPDRAVARGHHPPTSSKEAKSRPRHAAEGKRPAAPPVPTAPKPESAGRDPQTAPSRMPPERQAGGGGPRAQPPARAAHPPQSPQPPVTESTTPPSPAPPSPATPPEKGMGSAAGPPGDVPAP
ncbi:MAG TPA: sigma-70 family RNA polymerase sigma factor [Solirubrobacterales bacterium]|nr:sigma-70 family RNA polymerase sigma factor [Solirubrobacterales bacterium]